MCKGPLTQSLYRIDSDALDRRKFIGAVHDYVKRGFPVARIYIAFKTDEQFERFAPYQRTGQNKEGDIFYRRHNDIWRRVLRDRCPLPNSAPTPQHPPS